MDAVAVKGVSVQSQHVNAKLASGGVGDIEEGHAAAVGGTTLGWNDLHFRVKDKHILRGVTGESKPGRFCGKSICNPPPHPYY